MSCSSSFEEDTETRVVIRVEPINTQSLKKKFAKYGLEHERSVDVSASRVKTVTLDFKVYAVSVDGQGYNVCDLRLRAKAKHVVDRVQRVYFDGTVEFCFYDRSSESDQENVQFLPDSSTTDFILPLEPFGSREGDVLIRQAYTPDRLYVAISDSLKDQPLERNALFLEWSSCDVAAEQVARFNSLYPKQKPADLIDLSFAVSALRMVTNLSKDKAMIAKSGAKDIVLTEHLDQYCLGETLYDSHDDRSDFGGYKKRVVLEDRVFLKVMASDDCIEQICFGAPHRIPYPNERFMFLTDPPQMSILVLRIHLEETRAYLAQQPCLFSVGEATDWVQMTPDEKKERQQWLRERAEQEASYYTFFGSD